jgi:capsular polysaccharide biosynthesis protein
MHNQESNRKVHVLNQERLLDDSVQLVRVESSCEDEISLIDLWLVMAKRFKLIMAIVAIATLLGVLFALSKSLQYNYAASVQIGSMVVNQGVGQKFQFIESPQNVLAKLTESYIPAVIFEYAKTESLTKIEPEISARIPKDSNLIILETSGSDENSVLLLGLLQNVITRLAEDHKPAMNVTRGGFDSELMRAEAALADLDKPATLHVETEQVEIALLEAEIKLKELKDLRLTRLGKQKLLLDMESHKNKLSSLNDQINYFKAELKRLANVDVLLEKQIGSLSKTISEQLINRHKSESNVNTGPEAMTLLLIDNQIQDNRDRLAKVEERFYVTQHTSRRKLDNQIKETQRQRSYENKLLSGLDNQLQKMDIDNEYAQQKQGVIIAGIEAQLSKLTIDHKNLVLNQKQKIRDIKLKIKGLNDTQTLNEPMQSIKPMPRNRVSIVIVSIVAGLFLALFIVFGLEFLSKVKEKTLQQTA